MTRKKLLLSLVVLLVAVFLIGCQEALVDSEMVITSKDGAGIKTINVRIPRDHTESAANQNAGDVNSAFFPKGHKPVVEYIQSIVPEGVVVTFEEQDDYWVYSLTYNFTSINDYNDKTKALIPDDAYQLSVSKPATLTSKEADGGYELTFTEPTAVLNASVLHYIAQLHYQTDIFDNTQHGRTSRTPAENIELDSVKVIIGEKVNSVKTTAANITATGVLDSEGSSTPPPLPSPTEWPSPSPWPSLEPLPSKWKKMEMDKGDYTLAVLPDIQNLTDYYPEIFYSMTQWLADKAEEQNIAFMMQMGDLTNSDKPLQWHRARKGMDILKGAVPFAFAPGNHDYPGHISNRNSVLYNEHFPIDYFDNVQGVYEDGKIDNSYHTFTAGQHDYLVVTLEFGPRDEVLDWASEIISDYPDHRVIIITHCYMNHDGKRVGKKTTYTPYEYPIGKDPNQSVNDGEDIWDKLASQHENVFMVLSGHIPYPEVVHRIDEGVHGNKVIQVLVDPQSFIRGGDGLMLLLRFSDDGNTIGFEYYSPFRDEHYNESNQFTIDYINAELSEPYTPEPGDEPEPEPSDDPSDPDPTPDPSDDPQDSPTPEPSDDPQDSPTPEPSDDPKDPDDKDPKDKDPGDKSPKTSDKGILVYATISLIALGGLFVNKFRLSSTR